MIVLEQLAEARSRWASWDDDDLTIGSQHPFWPMVKAVDAVLEADQIWWCKTHNASVDVFDNKASCWSYRLQDHFGDDPSGCVTVQTVVVPVETPNVD